MQQQLQRIYRLRPYYRNLGLAGTSLFSVFGVVFTVLVIFNFNGNGPLAARAAAVAFPAIVLCGFMSLGVYLLLMYRHYRLTIDDIALRQNGVFSSKRVLIGSVREARWRTRPAGGSIVLTSPESTLTIEFDCFEKKQRDEIIALLHGLIPPELHLEWEPFYDRFLDESPEKIQQQDLGLVLFTVPLFGFSILFAKFWLDGRGVRFLFFAIVNIVLGLWIILRRRRSSKE